MRGHLADREMAELLAGTVDEATRAHLLECAACRQEGARLNTAVVDFSMDARTQAERPEVFFHRQGIRISSRMGAGRPVVWRWRSWASALATGALVAVFLTRGGTPPRSPADTEADQALLSAVQQAIYREAPVALSPAALLIADMERGGRQPN